MKTYILLFTLLLSAVAFGRESTNESTSEEVDVNSVNQVSDYVSNINDDSSSGGSAVESMIDVDVGDISEISEFISDINDSNRKHNHDHSHSNNHHHHHHKSHEDTDDVEYWVDMLRRLKAEIKRLQSAIAEYKDCIPRFNLATQESLDSTNYGVYFVSSEEATWKEATKSCAALGADLWHINSVEEYNALMCVIFEKQGNGTNYYWTAYNDCNRDGFFEYSTRHGLMNGYSVFGEDEPDNKGCTKTTEHALCGAVKSEIPDSDDTSEEMNPQWGKSELKDCGCKEKLYYVCELKGLCANLGESFVSDAFGDRM